MCVAARSRRSVSLLQSDWQTTLLLTYCDQRHLVRLDAWSCRVVLASAARAALYGSYLVDPASSHMLVSKIKPCMSKYKPLHGETANGSLNQKLFI